MGKIEPTNKLQKSVVITESNEGVNLLFIILQITNLITDHEANQVVPFNFGSYFNGFPVNRTGYNLISSDKLERY